MPEATHARVSHRLASREASRRSDSRIDDARARAQRTYRDAVLGGVKSHAVGNERRTNVEREVSHRALRSFARSPVVVSFRKPLEALTLGHRPGITAITPVSSIDETRVDRESVATTEVREREPHMRRLVVACITIRD